MWNLFGRYKGRKVLPSARQMNLIAAILNHVTQGTGIKMDMPQLPSTDSPWTIGIDVDWLKDFVGGDVDVAANKIVKTDADGDLDALCDVLTSAPSSDKVLTVKSGGTVVSWEDADDHEHTTSDITDWDTATADFLTDEDISDCLTTNDIGSTVAACSHTHSGYAASNHTHSEYAASNHTHSLSTISSSGCTASPSAPCFILSDAINGLYHSNQNPSVATVIAMCSAWTNNGNSFGTGNSNITTSDITDWSTATANFLTSSDVSDHITSSDLSTALSDYVTASELSAELSDYVTSSDLTTTLSDYLSSSDLSTALSDYITSSDLSTALSDYVTASELGEYLEEGDFASGFITATFSGVNSGTLKVVTGVTWNGTKLQYTNQTITVSKGLITSLGSSSTTDIDQPTVITWN